MLEIVQERVRSAQFFGENYEDNGENFQNPEEAFKFG